MIDPYIWLPVTTGIASGVVAAFYLSRKSRSLDCHDLVRRLHPHQLKGITDLIEKEEAASIFWKRTYGVRGLKRRWQNAIVLVQLAQVSYTMGFATPNDIEFILERAVKLTAETRKALMWGILRAIKPDVAAQQLQLCLKLYSEIAFRTHSLYADTDTHLCATMLASVL